MRWIDGHLDLAYLAVGGRDLKQSDIDPVRGCITLPAIRDANIELAFGTIFTEAGVFGPEHPHGYPISDDLDAAESVGMVQLAVYEEWQKHGEISLVRSRADLDAQTPLPKILILMEGADPIRSPDAVPSWFARGLRLVGLTWATGSRYSGGNGDGGPLKPPGARRSRRNPEACQPARIALRRSIATGNDPQSEPGLTVHRAGSNP